MATTFEHGDHVCVLYDTEEEQLTVAAAYVADGLRNHERCLYVADSDVALDRFVGMLSALGIDGREAEKRGALLLRTTSQAHLVDGHFDSERMLGLLNQTVEDALNDGYAGLRTCGDMSWLVDEPPGCSAVVEYEALLNPLFQSVRAVGMCQYDRRRLPAGLLDHALATHSSAVIDGRHGLNPFYKPPEIAATRVAQPGDLHWKISELRRR